MSAKRLLQTIALSLVGVLSLPACTSQGGTKAGGPAAPVVLRMATINGEAGYNPAVDDLLERIESLSNGNVQIEMDFRVGSFQPDAEQQVVRAVADGTYDLGVVGTRVFDTLGVSSFEALDAPMLIDSYELEASVIQSEIPGEMLRSLDALELSGLGLLADGLRKPIGVQGPLIEPSHWDGIGFGVYRSGVLAAATEALGASPVEAFGEERDRALADGSILGFEFNLLSYERLSLWQRAPYVTANVNLWPQTLAILGHPASLASLSEEQRGWLTRAIQETAVASPDLVKSDGDLIADLCRLGSRFATASDTDIADLRDAFVPVYADLERDAGTSRFIQRITELKQQVSTDALEIPDGCTGPAPNVAASPSAQPDKTTEVTALDGIWETSFTAEELQAADPVDESELFDPGLPGAYIVTFDRGDIIGPHQPDGEGQPGVTYVVEGDTLTIYAPDASMGGQIPPPGPAIWKYRWSIYNDTLTFEKLGGEEPGCSLTVSGGMCEPSVFIVKPWHRVQ